MDGTETMEAFWCNGKVGMTGTSYNGTLPLAAATAGSRDWRAIIPIAPNTSLPLLPKQRQFATREDTSVRISTVSMILFTVAILIEPATAMETIRDTEMAQGMDRTHGDYNDFWAGRDYLNHLGPMRAATLMAHAFNDWNVMPEHSVGFIRPSKKKVFPCRPTSTRRPRWRAPLKQMNRWFTLSPRHSKWRGE